MIVRPIKTRIFKEGERLDVFIMKYIPRVTEGSIVVVTSKIVALAERNTREFKNRKEKEKIIREESQWAMRTKYTWLTIKDNTVMVSAGVDESNARGKLILLPKDSFRTAAAIRRSLMKVYGVKRLGVVITDSRFLPLRGGAVGVALGYAGFKGIRLYKGKRDIFGRIFKYERTDVADSIATAAVLTMGEGNEQMPLALITGSPVVFVGHVRRDELVIDPREDLYQPLFERIKKIKLKRK